MANYEFSKDASGAVEWVQKRFEEGLRKADDGYRELKKSLSAPTTIGVRNSTPALPPTQNPMQGFFLVLAVLALALAYMYYRKLRSSLPPNR